METLIFALNAIRILSTRQEPVLDQAETLPAFDLQSLHYAYAAARRSAPQPSARNELHVAQAVS